LIKFLPRNNRISELAFIFQRLFIYSLWRESENAQAVEAGLNRLIIINAHFKVRFPLLFPTQQKTHTRRNQEGSNSEAGASGQVEQSNAASD